jgi:hypothetical protein
MTPLYSLIWSKDISYRAKLARRLNQSVELTTRNTFSSFENIFLCPIIFYFCVTCFLIYIFYFCGVLLQNSQLLFFCVNYIFSFTLIKQLTAKYLSTWDVWENIRKWPKVGNHFSTKIAERQKIRIQQNNQSFFGKMRWLGNLKIDKHSILTILMSVGDTISAKIVENLQRWFFIRCDLVGKENIFKIKLPILTFCFYVIYFEKYLCIIFLCFLWTSIITLNNCFFVYTAILFLIITNIRLMLCLINYFSENQLFPRAKLVQVQSSKDSNQVVKVLPVGVFEGKKVPGRAYGVFSWGQSP